MKKMLSILLVALLAAGACGVAPAAGGDIRQTVRQEANATTIVLLALFMVGTLWITKRAAKRTHSVIDLCTAGGGITDSQNGLTIPGDYMPTAPFPGISMAAMTSGYDGLIYSTDFLVSQSTTTFLTAEWLYSLGKFTFADVVGYQFEQDSIHSFATVGTLVVVAFYLIAQMVGVGQFIKLLFGLSYQTAVVIVGVLMMVYVLFGSITATIWVQITRVCMLLADVTFMAIMVLAQYSFSLEALFAKAVQIKTAIATNAGKSPDEVARIDLSVTAPGSFIEDPILTILFDITLMFGTAGLPRIPVRFFTVPDAKEIRRSVFWVTTWIGYFYILIFIIGFGAITLVLANPELSDVAKGVIEGGAGTASMTAVLVVETVGGDVFYGFILAVAFVTTLAMVAELTLSGAPAVSHDLYATVFKHGRANNADEPKASRITALALGVITMLLDIASERQNIAFMVSLAPAVATSANFLVLFLSMLWKGYTTRGAVIGGFLGLIPPVGLTIVSPSVWRTILGYLRGSAQFPCTSSASFSMTTGFMGVWLFSVLDSSVCAKNEKAPFAAQQVRSETGLGTADTSGR